MAASQRGWLPRSASLTAVVLSTAPTSLTVPAGAGLTVGQTNTGGAGWALTAAAASSSVSAGGTRRASEDETESVK